MKVVLLDSRRLELDLILYHLRSHVIFKVVEGVTNEEDLYKLLEKVKVDAVIGDFLTDPKAGLQIVKTLRMRFPWIPVVALSAQSQPTFLKYLRIAGAKGYASKTNTLEDLISTLKIVQKGKEDFTLEKPYWTSEDKYLTVREIEIVHCIRDALSNKEIAEKLEISIKSVESHRTNIFRKLKVKNVMQLLAIAEQQQLFA